MSIDLTSSGFSLINTYSSSTPVFDFDITFDWTSSSNNITEGADRQIITGSISYLTDGGGLRFYTFGSASSNPSDGSRSDISSIAWSQSFSTNYVMINDSPDPAALNTFTLGTLNSDTDISGEKLNMYLDVSLNRASTNTSAGIGEFSPQIFGKITSSSQSGNIYPEIVLAKPFTNLHIMRIRGQQSGNQILAYNLRQYSLFHSSKVGN
jgi:hypothetical protein